MTELKPCKRCGTHLAPTLISRRPEIIDWSPKEYQINYTVIRGEILKCACCAYSTPAYEYLEQAIDAWNRRIKNES